MLWANIATWIFVTDGEEEEIDLYFGDSGEPGESGESGDSGGSGDSSESVRIWYLVFWSPLLLNKLASLEATLVRNSADLITHRGKV